MMREFTFFKNSGMANLIHVLTEFILALFIRIHFINPDFLAICRNSSLLVGGQFLNLWFIMYYRDTNNGAELILNTIPSADR